MPRLLAGERPGRPHPASTDPVLPRRRPADGGIRWSQSNQAVYDFIRALTRPYPGAFSTLEGRRWFIWRAALPPGRWPAAGLAGTVLGPVVSPASDACGQLVACGEGGVILLEVEAKDGTILRGPDLSDQPWAGKQWTDD
jgi:methionyl-tRNA formyltransferase